MNKLAFAALMGLVAACSRPTQEPAKVDNAATQYVDNIRTDVEKARQATDFANEQNRLREEEARKAAEAE